MREKDLNHARPSSTSTGSSDLQDSPTLAFTLSLIAGIFILLGALMSLSFMRNSGMMGNSIPWMRGAWFPTTRIAGIVFGGLVLIAAIMLHSNTARHKTWGALILICSSLSVFTAMAGFGIGLLTRVMGGALAIAWIPGAPSNSRGLAARYCPGCGRGINFDALFCSYCGFQMPT